MKVATLKGGIRRIWVEVPSEEEGVPPEKVWVDYRPGELTLEIADRMKEAVATGFEMDIAEIMLAPILVDWDIEDEDGHLIPQNGGIKKVPISFLGLVFQAIQEDSLPNAQRRGTSEGSSLQKERQEASLSGTPGSEPQTDSESLSTD